MLQDFLTIALGAHSRSSEPWASRNQKHSSSASQGPRDTPTSHGLQIPQVWDSWPSQTNLIDSPLPSSLSLHWKGSSCAWPVRKKSNRQGCPTSGIQTPTDVRHNTKIRHGPSCWPWFVLFPQYSLRLHPCQVTLRNSSWAPMSSGWHPQRLALLIAHFFSVILLSVKTQISLPLLPPWAPVFAPSSSPSNSLSQSSDIGWAPTCQVLCARCWNRMIEMTWTLLLYNLASSFSSSLPYTCTTRDHIELSTRLAVPLKLVQWLV